jgi:hypothetical protein
VWLLGSLVTVLDHEALIRAGMESQRDVFLFFTFCFRIQALAVVPERYQSGHEVPQANLEFIAQQPLPRDLPR